MVTRSDGGRRPSSERVGSAHQLAAGCGPSDERGVAACARAARGAGASATAPGGCRTWRACRPRRGFARAEELGDLARRGRPAQRFLDPLHDQQERDQQGREEDDAEGDHCHLLDRPDAARSPGDRCMTRRRYPSAAPPTLDACSVRIDQRPVAGRRPACAPPRPTSARPVRRPRRGAHGASPFDPAETPLARTRRARRMARELAVDPPRRALRAGLHQRLRAAGRHGPVGADHRQDGQQGHADAVREVPGRRAPCAGADRDELEAILKPTGFFRAKANSVLGPEPGAGRAVRRRGARPAWPTWSRCPASGRKTANVVLGNAFGVPGLTVDTHFGRLVRRFGWTAEEDPVKVEAEIAELIPKKRVDRLQPPGDLPRPAGVPRQEGGLRRLRAGPVVPLVRHRPGRPRGRAEAGQDAGRLGHRVSAAAAGRVGRSPRSPLLAGCTSGGADADAARPSAVAGVSALKAVPRAAGAAGAGAARPCPRCSFACLGGGSLDLRPGPGRARRWSTSGAAGARRAATSCRCCSSSPTPPADRVRVVGVISKDGLPQAESFAERRRGHVPQRRSTGEGELMAGVGLNALPVHLLPRRRRRAWPTRQVGPVASIGPAASSWSPTHLGVQL